MEGEPEGHGRVGWLQAGPTLRTHPTEAMLKMAALLPLPLPPLPQTSSLFHSPVSPPCVCVCAGGRHLPGRRGWNGNPPGWPRSARSRNSSSQPQPTRHYPTASDKKERDRQRERARERARERQTPRGKGGRGDYAHAQIIIQLNKGFTYRHTRTRNSGRINNPRGEWYQRGG